jgi:hypothetical protein
MCNAGVDLPSTPSKQRDRSCHSWCVFRSFSFCVVILFIVFIFLLGKDEVRKVDAFQNDRRMENTVICILLHVPNDGRYVPYSLMKKGIKRIKLRAISLATHSSIHGGMDWIVLQWIAQWNRQSQSGRLKITSGNSIYHAPRRAIGVCGRMV